MNQVNDPLTAWVLEDPASRGPLVLAIFGTLFVVPLVLFAVYFYRMGSRAIAGGKFPPDGYRMLRTTDPVSGDAALRQGRIVRILSMLLIAGAVGIVVVLWRIASLFTRVQV